VDAERAARAAWTAASHWARSLQYILLRGDSFTLIERNALGTPKGLVPLPWEAVVPDRANAGFNARNRYLVNDGLSARGYDQDDVLHFPGYGFNGLRGMSALAWGARNAAGNAMAMDEYSGRFFADGAHPSIILSTDHKMDAGQVGQLQQMFADKYSGTNNAHRRPLVLTEGLKATEVSINAQDAQLLEARKFQVIDIARAFGVPPHLIGETSASTSWGSGIESMGRAFVLFTLETHLTRLEQELNRKLFRVAGTFLEFDRSMLMEGDLVAQAQYYRAAIGGPGSGPGWMAVDEVRQRKYLAPKGGKSAEIFNPNDAPAKPAKEPTP
jgi:HK97 family phage portal protein